MDNPKLARFSFLLAVVLFSQFFSCISSLADPEDSCEDAKIPGILEEKQVEAIKSLQEKLPQSSGVNLKQNPDAVQKLVTGGLNSMNFWTKEHQLAQRDTGIGLFYGYDSPYAKMDEKLKNEHLETKKRYRAYPETPRETTCIDWVYSHLKAAYKSAGLLKRWEEIESIVRSKDSDGIFLMQEMRKDGWEAVYWNMDVKKPIAEADHHKYFANQVEKTGQYSGIPIDHKMLNFRTTNPQEKETKGLDALKDVPFWVGIADGAYHVFLGHNLNVNEAHSALNPDSYKVIEDRPLEKWGTESKKKFLSGVIMVPPGSWKEPK